MNKTKGIIIALLLCSFNIAFSQMSYINEEITYDIDHSPVYVNFSKNKLSTDSLYYIKAKGKLVKIKCDIDFLGSKNQFDTFCDSLYYNSGNYYYQEMNQAIKFCVIFDENLNIQDVRFFSRFHDIYDKIKNYLMFYDMLKKTEGHWTTKDRLFNSWHLYEGRYVFY